MDDVKVEQVDRDRAARIWAAHSSHQQSLEIAAGEHDDWPVVQEVAKHRLATAIRERNGG